MTRIAAIASAFAVAFVGATAFARGASAEGAKMTHVDNAQAMDIKSMEMPGIDARLGRDVVGSDDPEKPITCAFFRLESSAEPLTYDYDYDEVKIVLDGVITVSDGSSASTPTRETCCCCPRGRTSPSPLRARGLPSSAASGRGKGRDRSGIRGGMQP